MLRITRIDDAENCPTIKLEGKLLGLWVEEVARAVAASNASGECLRLDLSSVSHADTAGIALLRSLLARRITIAGSSGYIARLLAEDESRHLNVK